MVENRHLCRAMLCKRGLCRHAVSVCLPVSVTFVNSIKTNKHIIKIFSPSGSHAILVFFVQNIAILWRNPPNGVVKCRWRQQKSRFWAYIWLYRMLLTLQQAGVVNIVASGPRPPSRKYECDTSLVVSGGVDCGRRRRNVYDKKPQRYAKYNRTALLTARSDKSVAYVTNTKRLYSTFYTVEANYWQTRNIARPLCDSRDTCFIRHLHLTPPLGR